MIDINCRDTDLQSTTPPLGIPASTSLDLYWIPLGAGARVVRLSGRIYEAVCAWAHRRPRRALYHSALVANIDGDRFVIEVTPIPRLPETRQRGVVAEGAVGLGWAGRFRVFRYEIRRWRNGVIPDISHAVSSPVHVTDDPDAVRHALALVPTVPTPVWGRDELHHGEMWNSNSVVAWLLVRAGVDAAAGHPPNGGRAPGWDAGVIEGRRAHVGDPAPVSA